MNNMMWILSINRSDWLQEVNILFLRLLSLFIFLDNEKMLFSSAVKSADSLGNHLNGLLHDAENRIHDLSTADEMSQPPFSTRASFSSIIGKYCPWLNLIAFVLCFECETLWGWRQSAWEIFPQLFRNQARDSIEWSLPRIKVKSLQLWGFQITFESRKRGRGL